jgi:replicative DNA helicase
VPNWKVRKGCVASSQWGEIDAAVESERSVSHIVVTASGLTLSQVQAITRLNVLKHGVRSVVIDYLFQMDLEQKRGDNEEKAIRQAMWKLHSMAKQLGVSVALLQQLSRDKNRTRANEPPVMSDLKGSQAIEAESDVVMLLWRPDFEKCKAERRLFDVFEFRMDKQRNSPPCWLKMQLDCEHVRIVTPTDEKGPMAVANIGADGLLTVEEDALDDIPFD